MGNPTHILTAATSSDEKTRCIAGEAFWTLKLQRAKWKIPGWKAWYNPRSVRKLRCLELPPDVWRRHETTLPAEIITVWGAADDEFFCAKKMDDSQNQE